MTRNLIRARTGQGGRQHYLRAATSGFTIVEVLIAAAIMGILMAAIYSVLMSGRSTYSSGEVKADIQQNARLAMETITADLRLIGYGVPTDPTLPNPNLEKITSTSATAITFRADLANMSTTLGADIVAGATTLPTSDTKGITANDKIYLINGGTFYPTTFPGVQVTGVTLNTSITIASGDGTKTYPQGTQIGRPLQIGYCWGSVSATACPATIPSFIATTIYKNDGTQPAGSAQEWQPLAINVTSFALSYFDANDTALPAATTTSSTDKTTRANIRRIVVTMEVQEATPVGKSGTQKYKLTSDIRPRNLF